MNDQNKTILMVIIIAAVIGFAMWGIPNYKVYSLELNGKAQLKEAEWNRQIAVQEADALPDSAHLKADAEVIRAGGIAET